MQVKTAYGTVYFKAPAKSRKGEVKWTLVSCSLVTEGYLYVGRKCCLHVDSFWDTFTAFTFLLVYMLHMIFCIICICNFGHGFGRLLQICKDPLSKPPPLVDFCKKNLCRAAIISRPDFNTVLTNAITQCWKFYRHMQSTEKINHVRRGTSSRTAYQNIATSMWVTEKLTFMCKGTPANFSFWFPFGYFFGKHKITFPERCRLVIKKKKKNL